MSIVRNLVTVGSTTLVSRVLGFVRDAGVAALLGAGPLADAYVVALQIPNLFRRLLADGAVNAAFIPAWLRIRRDSGLASARKFGFQSMAAVTAILCVVVLTCVVFAPAVIGFLAPGFEPGGPRADVAIWLLRMALFYVVLAGAAAVAMAVLNAEGDVASGGVGVVAFNVVLVAAIAVAITAGVSQSGSVAGVLAASFVVAGTVQFAIIMRAMNRRGLLPDRLTLETSPEVRRVLSRALPGALAAGVPQIVLIVAAMFASSSSSAVAWLYYTFRLYELPLGLVSVAVAGVLTRHIAASIVERDPDTIAAAKSQSLEVALGLALPAATGLALLALPITRLLFQRGAFGPEDTIAVAAALTAIAAGLAGHAIEKVSAAVSFAHDDTRTPMLTALAGLAVSGAAAALLFPRFGHVGVAAAIALSGWSGGLLLVTIVWRRGWIVVARSTVLRLLGIVSSTLLMAVAVVVLKTFQVEWFAEPVSFIGQAFWLSLLIGAGIAVYLASLWQLGIANVPNLLANALARP